MLELKRLILLTNKIFESDLSWDAKYDLIFSTNISKKIHSLVTFDYYDPDTSSEEDVTAFVEAINQLLKA